MKMIRHLPRLLWAGLLGTAMTFAAAAEARKGDDQFVPTKLRSEYLRMPASELSPMLDWLEGLIVRSGATRGADAAHVSPLLVHAMLLHGQSAQALSMIQAARASTDKALQRDMLFFTEGLLAEARTKGWTDAQLAAAAKQRVAALPWPAARSRLKDLLHALDVTPFEQTLTAAGYSDEAYRLAPLNAPDMFASDIVETRFAGEILGPHAARLRSIIKDRLDHAPAEAGYWRQRAYPTLPQHGQTVRVAVWEPEGVDIGLFEHPDAGCLILGPGADCLVDPHIDGVDRPRAWAFVKGFQDTASGETSPEAKAWEDWRGEVIKEMAVLDNDPGHRQQLVKAMHRLGSVTNEVASALPRQHGTHVAGIIVEGNPFVELVAIRDPQLLDARADRFRRIAEFLRANKVRVVNMSWGLDTGSMPAADVAAFEKHMLDLMAAFPDTLFVAAAGNDDNSIDKRRFLPAGLNAPNLLTIGAVDQDGQVTFFTNVGSGVSLYANGNMVHSIGPTGYPLDMSGTSMAAPQVCNAAAKLLSQHAHVSVAELKRLLIDGADELPAGDQVAAPMRILNPARSAVLSGG